MLPLVGHSDRPTPVASKTVVRPMEMSDLSSLPAIRVWAETEFSLEFDVLTDPRPTNLCNS